VIRGLETDILQHTQRLIIVGVLFFLLVALSSRSLRSGCLLVLLLPNLQRFPYKDPNVIFASYHSLHSTAPRLPHTCTSNAAITIACFHLSLEDVITFALPYLGLRNQDRLAVQMVCKSLRSAVRIDESLWNVSMLNRSWAEDV
jgi:hypothetical protein